MYLRYVRVFLTRSDSDVAQPLHMLLAAGMIARRIRT